MGDMRRPISAGWLSVKVVERRGRVGGAAVKKSSIRLRTIRRRDKHIGKLINPQRSLRYLHLVDRVEECRAPRAEFPPKPDGQYTFLPAEQNNPERNIANSVTADAARYGAFCQEDRGER